LSYHLDHRKGELPTSGDGTGAGGAGARDPARWSEDYVRSTSWGEEKSGGMPFGFRVSGFGFRVSGFGFRVSGLGFWVSGLKFRVSGFGFGVRCSFDLVYLVFSGFLSSVVVLTLSMQRTYHSWGPEYINRSVLHAQSLFVLAWFHAIIKREGNITAP
jgi:hypothetical protein